MGLRGSGAKLGAAAAWSCLMVGIGGALISAFIGYRLIDETYMLYYSWLLSLGSVPYRDFFVVYPPGAFALIGLVFKLFGAGALAGRVTVLVSSAVTAACVYALAAALTDRRAALASTGIALAWGVPVYNTPHPNWYALALLMGAAVASRGMSGARGGSLKSAFVVGLLVGLSATVKQSIGALALVGFGVVVLIAATGRRADASGQGERAGARGLAFAYAGGFALPVAATAGVLAVLGALGPAFSAVVLFTPAHRGYFLTQTLPPLSIAGAAMVLVLAAAVLLGTDWGPVRSVVRWAGRGPVRLIVALGSIVLAALVWRLHPPTGGPGEIVAGAAWGLAFYGLPVVFVGVGIAFLRQRSPHEDAVMLAALTVVAAVMFFERGGASDWSHLLYVVPPALVLGTWVVRSQRLSVESGSIRTALPVLLVGVLLVGPLAYPSANWARLIGGRLRSLPGAYRGIMVEPSEAGRFARLWRWLAQAPEGRKVYAYPIDLGPVFAASRVSAGYHLQLVYKLSLSESLGEVDRIRAERPVVVVARDPRPWGPLDPGRYSSLNEPLLRAATQGLRVVDRTGDFTVYAEAP